MNITPTALLALNILLQGLDGTLSYLLMSVGFDEANPLVQTAIQSWGLGWGLLYWKLFSCMLLFLLFSVRFYRKALTVGALTFTAVVYSYLAVFLVWRWVEIL